MALQTSETIETALRNAVEKEAAILRERFIQEFVVNFEQQLRRTIGNAAIDLSRFFSVKHMGEELIITVKVEK